MTDPLEQTVKNAEANILSVDELKRAKSRAKKNNISFDDAKHSIILEKNTPKANELWDNFMLELAKLGFSAMPILTKTPNSIVAEIKVLPLGRDQQAKVMQSIQSAIDQRNNLKDEQNMAANQKK